LGFPILLLGKCGEGGGVYVTEMLLRNVNTSEVTDIKYLETFELIKSRQTF